MAIGVCEVDAAATGVVVDLAGAPFTRIGPVRNPALANAAKDRIKVAFVDQKSIVMGCNVAFDLIEIERRTVVEVDHLKTGRRALARAGRERLQEISLNAVCRGTRRWCG